MNQDDAIILECSVDELGELRNVRFDVVDIVYGDVEVSSGCVFWVLVGAHVENVRNFQGNCCGKFGDVKTWDNLEHFERRVLRFDDVGRIQLTLLWCG